MNLFGKKKDKIVDWSERYKIQEKRAITNKKAESSSGLGFLGDMAKGTSSSNNVSWDNDTPSQNQDYVQEKRQKLTKRLLDMTSRIEDLSNQIYHLKQRIEVLEKKLKINFE
jgi:peptidoglycan hydrolase CwlO-like protein